jgi:hypothetical protein
MATSDILDFVPPIHSKILGNYIRPDSKYDSDSQQPRLRVKTGSMSVAEFEKIKNLYNHENNSFRVEFSKKVLRQNKIFNRLNMASQNELATLAQKTTNPIQINDYNHLRNTQTAMYFPDNKKKNYDWTKSYDLHNDILGAKKNQPYSSVINNNREAAGPNVDLYKSANGTVFKHYSVSGENQMKIEQIDYPTKNVIHVPGKYHEHYRQYASVEEIPQNLRHKFRTRETEKLLKDEIKVHDTLAKIYNQGVYRKQNKEKDELNKIENITNISAYNKNDKHHDYNELGNILRHTVSHGIPITFNTGLKEEVHNNEVSKLYLSDPSNIESPYRRKKDWLSMYIGSYYFFKFLSFCKVNDQNDSKIECNWEF